MAHGEAARPLESTDASPVVVKDGELAVKDRQLAILEHILVEIRKTNDLLERIVS